MTVTLETNVTCPSCDHKIKCLACGYTGTGGIMLDNGEG